MTKPGTRRWNTTLSYQPHSASAMKLPVAMGERSAVIFISILPASVLNDTVRVSPAGSAGGCEVGQPASPSVDASGAGDRAGVWIGCDVAGGDVGAEPALHAATSSGIASAASTDPGWRRVMRRSP